MRRLLLILALVLATAAFGFTGQTWNGTPYEIPDAGDRNWAGLSAFLDDLAQHAQTINRQLVAIRVATTTPVTVSSSSDYTVVTNLGTPGAVAVNLPAGVAGQEFTVVDGKGDAQTNNVTITPAAGQINGASTYVIKTNHGGVTLDYNGTSWTVVSEFTAATTGTGLPASATNSGYLTSTDWSTFNTVVSKVPSSRNVNTTAPITGGGALSADLTLSMPAATVSGNGYLSSVDWATFNGRDVARSVSNLTEATSSVLTITGGSGAVIGAGTTVQVKQATVAQNGYLASADWATFNGRVATTRNVSTTAPITGGGPLSSDLTIAIPAATLTANGYLASADWATFNGKQPLLSAASVTVNGYLASGDWATFNGRVATTRSISTTAPITGGGDLSANRTFAIPKANNTTDGYISSTDWTSFNALSAGSVPSSRNVNTTAPITGGGALSADLTIAIPAGTISANGYLASGDWAAFNAARVDASTSNRGMINTTTQTLGGVKTFNSGIAFTQTNASGTGVSSTGATLNDYEEGTWTPIAATSGTSFSSVTYTTNGQQGRYTRNGRIVCIQAYMQWSATTGSPTGNLGIGQLPFSAANVTNLVTPLATTADNIAYPAGFTSATAEVQSNNNVAYLIATENNVGATNVLAASNTGGTRSIRIAGCYSL